MSFTATITVSVIAVVILLCDNASFVGGSSKIKTHEGTPYALDRKVMCALRPRHVEWLLYDNCAKKRKRMLTGRLVSCKLTLMP